MVVTNCIKRIMDTGLFRAEKNKIGALLYFRALVDSGGMCLCVLAVLVDCWDRVCALPVVGKCCGAS